MRNYMEERANESRHRAEQEREVFDGVYGATRYIDKLVELAGDPRWNDPNIPMRYLNVVFTLGRGNGQTLIAQRTAEFLENTRPRCFNVYQSMMEYRFDGSDEDWDRFSDTIVESAIYTNHYEGLCVLDITALGSYICGPAFRNLMQYIRRDQKACYLLYVDPEDAHADQLIEQVNKNIQPMLIYQGPPKEGLLVYVVIKELEKYMIHNNASNIHEYKRFVSLAEFKRIHTIRDAITLTQRLAWKIPGVVRGEGYSMEEIYRLIEGRDEIETKIGTYSNDKEENKACTVKAFPNRM